MKHTIRILGFVATAITLMSCSKPAVRNDNRTHTTDFSVVEAQFADPDGEFRPAPLWTWNAKVTTEDIDRMLKDFKDQGFGGAFIHPRPGLETEYLSDEWFRLWKYSVEKGGELGLDIWIYDENSYPSGFAGGHMYREMPESSDHPTGFGLIDGHLAIVAAGPRRFCGDVPYVDLIYPGVTEKFLELTMSGYEKTFGKNLGALTHGSFSDEPECPDWTTDFPEQFMADWGYDIVPHLDELWREEPENWRETRFRYSYTRQRLFQERWGQVYHDWCDAHDMLWTGHYWEHEWPDLRVASDHMAMYAYHQMPAIDLLMNIYNDDDPKAQYGNVRSVKELRSVANQMGRVRTLCESYGAGGWDMTFEDFRRLADWEYALGVNFMNQHYSNITIEGARKFDHPDYFTGYSPWAADYKVLNDHVARLSLALSQGDQRNDIVVLEPNATLWLYNSVEDHSHEKNRLIGQKFQRLVTALEKAQVEFDLASEMTIKDYGRVEGGKFIVGECAYSTVIIPEGVETLLGPTAKYLCDFAAAGGRIVALSKPWSADSVECPELEALWESAAYITEEIDLAALQESRRVRIDQYGFEGFRLQTENENGGLFHMTREYDGGTLLYMTNSYQDRTLNGTVTIKGKGVKKMDTMSGGISLLASAEGPDGTVVFPYSIPPCCDLMVFAADDAADLKGLKPAAELPSEGWQTLAAEGPMDIRRLKDNYLLLDFCNLKVDDKLHEEVYVADACNMLFEDFGMQNPWNSTIQYKNIFTDVTFDSGDVTVEYPFVIAEDFDWSGTKLVCEKPWLWEVRVNGEKVTPIDGEHPLDARNGAFRIGKFLHKGANEVTLHIDRMSIYAEVSFAFITGNFSVVPSGEMWVIAAPQDEMPGSWKDNGMPFYSWDVAYSQTYSVSDASVPCILELGKWKGTVCEVYVNSQKAGVIFAQPYTFDLTGLLKEGENTVELRCIGSLANLFGPHNGPRQGSMWPGMWGGVESRYPASDYVFDDYGLVEPFSLRINR